MCVGGVLACGCVKVCVRGRQQALSHLTEACKCVCVGGRSRSRRRRVSVSVCAGGADGRLSVCVGGGCRRYRSRRTRVSVC